MIKPLTKYRFTKQLFPEYPVGSEIEVDQHLEARLERIQAPARHFYSYVIQTIQLATLLATGIIEEVKVEVESFLEKYEHREDDWKLLKKRLIHYYYEVDGEMDENGDLDSFHNGEVADRVAEKNKDVIMAILDCAVMRQHPIPTSNQEPKVEVKELHHPKFEVTDKPLDKVPEDCVEELGCVIDRGREWFKDETEEEWPKVEFKDGGRLRICPWTWDMKTRTATFEDVCLEEAESMRDYLIKCRKERENE